MIMDYDAFYDSLFAPLESSLGPIDSDTICAIIGFDAGGPLNFCTIGNKPDVEFITYVSCELAIRKEQKPASFGRYELLATCNDEQWVRSTLTALGHASMDIKFGHRHSLDIGAWVESDDLIQGLILEREATAQFDGKKFGVLRAIGVTRAELDLAVIEDMSQLVARLKEAGIYPRTDVRRESVV